jgi:hypothetical protein
VFEVEQEIVMCKLRKPMGRTLFVFLLIGGAALVSGSFYESWGQEGSETSSGKQSGRHGVESTEEGQTEGRLVPPDWSIYHGEQYVFEFKYPPNFIREDLRSRKPDVFVVGFCDKQWESRKIHHPGLYITVLQTTLSPREWLYANNMPLEACASCRAGLDPPHGFTDVRQTFINGVAVLQFTTYGASGSTRSTIFKKEPNTIYIVDAHSCCNGDFPQDIYRRILSTFQVMG